MRSESRKNEAVYADKRGRLLERLQSASPQSKIVGYLGTGIGAELSLSPAWGVRLELDYAVFFERLQPIMGYAPALYGFYRFGKSRS